MPKDELEREIAHGVTFWVAEEEGRASWAIEFYRRNGFTVVAHSDKDNRAP